VLEIITKVFFLFFSLSFFLMIDCKIFDRPKVFLVMHGKEGWE